MPPVWQSRAPAAGCDSRRASGAGEALCGRGTGREPDCLLRRHSSKTTHGIILTVTSGAFQGKEQQNAGIWRSGRRRGEGRESWSCWGPEAGVPEGEDTQKKRRTSRWTEAQVEPGDAAVTWPTGDGCFQRARELT